MDRFEQRGFSGLVVADDDVDAATEIGGKPAFETLEILYLDLLDVHRLPYFQLGNNFQIDTALARTIRCKCRIRRIIGATFRCDGFTIDRLDGGRP